MKGLLTSRVAAIAVVGGFALGLAGCFGSGSSNSSTTANTSTGASTSTLAGGSTSTQGANSPAAEAQSAAAGDIPDNQKFLTYRNTAAGYSILYPEGWSRSGTGNNVTFQDKDNIVTITTRNGQASSTPVHTTLTKPGPVNPVTGKRPTLMIDRYVIGHNGKVATVDEGTPKGVDNVDAYKMIIQSFKWS